MRKRQRLAPYTQFLDGRPPSDIGEDEAGTQAIDDMTTSLPDELAFGELSPTSWLVEDWNMPESMYPPPPSFSLEQDSHSPAPRAFGGGGWCSTTKDDSAPPILTPSSPSCHTSETTTTGDCQCNSAILGCLERILSCKEHSSRLGTLAVLRDLVADFCMLAQCTKCVGSPSSPRSMLMLLVLAEKLADQFPKLLFGNKELSRHGQHEMRYGEYHTCTEKERYTIYLGLLGLQARTFVAALETLLRKAKDKNWVSHAATLQTLISQIEGLEQGIAKGYPVGIQDSGGR
ncbi:hypothetical protein MMYC01_201598 [Madurella mycetomatis]|uniref:Uncharacterized protein n=1 Tax=Madurella mycetomatis TaxID=100816 RepID=A0A175WCA4_9PEZI|nr:hypothetical protein MMYC01_201598 [Madurella mycetomatis]